MSSAAADTSSSVSVTATGSIWSGFFGVQRGIGTRYSARMTPSRLLASLILSFAATVHAQTVPVTVHADRVVGEIRPIWNYFGYDEAGTTLTREGRDLLGKLNALSHEPIRIRVHHLLTSGDGTLALKWSSTNVYTEDAAGNPRYDWTRLDAIMDELTRPGIEPFVQASFMPQALSSQPEPYTPSTGEDRDCRATWCPAARSIHRRIIRSGKRSSKPGRATAANVTASSAHLPGCGNCGTNPSRRTGAERRKSTSGSTIISPPR